MDFQRTQFQSLGFFGIYKEAYKTIISAKKIFTLITLAMIFPLSASTFSYLHIMHFLLYKIVDNCDALLPAPGSAADKGILDHLPSFFLWIITFGIASFSYVFVISIFYLLCTTTVLYTQSCVYSGKDMIVKTLLNVVHPKVSKRFLNYVQMMLFHQFVVLSILTPVWLWTSAERCNCYVMVLRGTLVVTLVDVIGCAIYNPFWHLVCVKSIFEDMSATQARALIFGSNNGKFWFAHNVVVAIQHFMIISFYVLVFTCDKSLGIASKETYGIIYILLHSIMILLGLVVQNIIYFIYYKAYHGESIDKSCQTDHVGVAEKI
ncbi:hypothetical protein AQUCO_01500158v1 [Aquilegia coerulea]|uniref:Uncharacterized protein n=1 Tax=Aquilegia coerulea TaxID=218851 RepID=A0A2G5DT47_AQUCA|nr:hypothetical protein AQUCO_01500158v1 [Aquilegia coerulea]